MQRTLLLSLVSLSLASVPTSVRADALLSDPASAPEPALPPPSAPSAELSIGVSPMLGLGGLGGLANGVGLALVPSIDVALMLDPRVALVLGGQFSAQSAETFGSGVGVWVPLLLQVYLDEPRVGAIVPTIRVGIVAQYFGSEGFQAYGGGARLSGGVTWIADRWLALRLEVGGGVDAMYGEVDRWVQVSGSLDARGSVVIRL
ncbi:MAG: hypothetical protein M3Y87_34780 [Myxococcota bacterium]|nr:hypothetical protein [Myxococcota bacterium]